MATLTTLGSGIWVSTMLGDPEGWHVLLTAPVAGLAAGIAAGLIAAFRHMLSVGFLLALVGLAIGVLVGSLSWGPLGEGATGRMTFIVSVTGIPFAIGYGVVALSRTASGRDFLLWIGSATLWHFLTRRRS
ncbi:MAG: hypothetical protein V2B17_01605 [Chloroflexota bacterium]